MYKIRQGKKYASGIGALFLCLFCACGGDVQTVLGPAAEPDTEEAAQEIQPDARQDPYETPGLSDPLTETPAGTEEAEMSAKEDGGAEITITVSAVGDVALGTLLEHEYPYSFAEKYDEEGPAYFFSNVWDILSADDCTIINMEGPLTDEEEHKDKQYVIKGSPEYISILPAGSVEMASLANNHIQDYFGQGAADTQMSFEEERIAYAYNDITAIYETKGIRIGLVAAAALRENVGADRYLQKGIAKLKEEGADLIIAYCHWGIEREYYPDETQIELGHQCIDWGADLVLGSHPHVLQGIELYEGKFIVYSLSNFCFGANRNPPDKDTMIFQQTFTFLDGVKQEDAVCRIIPCSVSSVSGRNDFCPTPAVGSEYERILNKIRECSAELGTEFSDNGYFIVG